MTTDVPAPALAAHVVGHRDQFVRDRTVPALKVPALGRTPQVAGLQARADLGGQLAGGIVEALANPGRSLAAHIGGGDDGHVRDVDDLHTAGPVVQKPGGRIQGAQEDTDPSKPTTAYTGTSGGPEKVPRSGPGWWRAWSWLSSFTWRVMAAPETLGAI